MTSPVLPSPSTPTGARPGVRRFAAAGLATATLVVLAGCSSQSPGEAGVELIDGELGETLAFGPLDATCAEPAAVEVGETFTCTATTEDGATIEFDGVVDPDDMIFVASSNVVYADDLSTVETEAVRATAEEFDVDPTTLTVDCPDENTILDDSVVTCVITDTTEGPPYELFVTFGDFVLREGFDGLSYELGAPIE